MEEKILKNLIEDAKKGKEKAIESLYNESKNDVYFFCMRVLNNHENALDIMQDTFITVFEKLSTLKDYRTFFKWQKVIAINKCKNFLAKNKEVLLSKENEEYDDEYFHMEELNNEFIPHEYIESKEKREIILNIIDKNLSEVQKMVIMLFYYEEKSIKDISEILECSQGTVKSRLFKSRDILKAAIEKYEKKGIKLHSLSGISILSVLLREAAKEYKLPNEASALVLGKIKNELKVKNQGLEKVNNNNEKTYKKIGEKKELLKANNKNIVSYCKNIVSKISAGIKGATIPQIIAGGVVCTTLVAGGMTTVLGINNNGEKKNNEALAKNNQSIESSTLTSYNKNKKNIEKETSTITENIIREGEKKESDLNQEVNDSQNFDEINLDNSKEKEYTKESSGSQDSNKTESNLKEIIEEPMEPQESPKNEIVVEEPQEETPKPQPEPEKPKPNNPAAGTYNAEMTSWLNQVLINNGTEDTGTYGMESFISYVDRGEIPAAGTIKVSHLDGSMNGPTAVVGPYYFNTKTEDMQYWDNVFSSSLCHDSLYIGAVRVRVFNDGNGGWYVNAYYMTFE